MSYALIDNASLTAIERTLGDIIVKTRDTINGDLVAFENAIQAILFYDELICIDNYKTKYKEARAKKFSFIRFLPETEYKLNEVERLAKSEARLLQPEIRGGEFADEDFRSLIEILKLSMVCTWDKSSSVYYLTMKMLGQPNTPEYEKYSELSASIYNELSDSGTTNGLWSTDVKLVSASGHVFSEEEFSRERKNKSQGMGGMTNALEMFIASLNWLAYKAIYYSIAAKHLKADTFLHPIRHAYQMHWMRKTGAFGHDYTAKIIHNLSQKLNTTVSEIINHGRASTLTLDLPIISAWLAEESGGVKHIINSALELKKHDHFASAREAIRDIHIAFDEQGLGVANKKVTKLLAELEKISGDIKRKYGVRSSQGIQGSFLIKSINSLTSIGGIPAIPEIDFALSTPNFMKSKQHKAFSTIFKDVTNELTSIERLGGFRDKLAAEFKIEDAGFAPKTENPRFRYYSSDWKQPM